MTPAGSRRTTSGVCAGLFAGVLATHPALAQTSDLFEGLIVREIRISGLRSESTTVVEQNLATRVGEPFSRANLDADRRQLGELRLFSSVSVEPRLENRDIIVDVVVVETLRVLPAVVIRVTDENGLSAGPGVRTINLLGRRAQFGFASRFGGETSFAGTIDRTTITPGAFAWHLGVSYSTRRNTIYEFDEEATTVEGRVSRNWRHGVKTGVAGDFTTFETGTSGAALSPDGRDVITTVGGFTTFDGLDSSTDPRAGTWAEVQVDRLFGDAASWTFTLDGRRYQPLSARHGVAIFTLATFQTGEVGVTLPEYLQFALGGGNTVRGWSLASRRGRHQFIGTLEYTWVVQPVTPFTVGGLNLYGGMQVVGFADVGFAWTGDAATTEAAIDGYGIGVRFLVPYVDVIRIDLAWGEPGQGASAYFGVSLKPSRQRQRVR